MSDTELENTESILKELKTLKSDRKKEAAFVAIVPLIVAAMTVFFTTKMQRDQLSASQDIESAKLIQSFSALILEGGEKAELARIAFETVPLTETQSRNLAKFLEAAGNSSAEIPADQSVGYSLANNLDLLFSESEQDRSLGYGQLRQYLNENGLDDSIASMIQKIENEPYNIKGRSNILSILAELPAAHFASVKDLIAEQLDRIIELKDISPAYAVGPQTQAWISTIRKKL